MRAKTPTVSDEKKASATRGQRQRGNLPVSRSTYVLEEQQGEFGIDAPVLFYLLFFFVFGMIIFRNPVPVGLLTVIQGYIARKFLKEKPAHYLTHLVSWPMMHRRFTHQCGDKEALFVNGNAKVTSQGLKP